MYLSALRLVQYIYNNCFYKSIFRYRTAVTMRRLWRCRGCVQLWLNLLLVDVQINCAFSASTNENFTTIHTQSLASENGDAIPPVFCLDAGVEIAFPRQDVENAMDSTVLASAGTACLRTAPLNAVMGHLKTSLRTLSIHEVDCVLEPLDVESSTIALLGIVSVCLRSNMEIENDIKRWGHESKRKIDELFASDKHISLNQIKGMARQVLISPPYALPNSGSGLPQFVLDEVLVWSRTEEGETFNASNDQTFLTYVQMVVKNDGTTPLHIFQVTIAKKIQGSTELDLSVSFVLPLVAPAVIQPGKSDVVSFKAITDVVVDSSNIYLMYISHSGFRSHIFEGSLKGKTFLWREENIQTQDDHEVFDQFSLNSAGSRAFFAAFPYATWQVGFMALAMAVGIVVVLYIRRKRPSVRVVSHVVLSCFRLPGKKKLNKEIGGRTSAKATPIRVAISQTEVSKRGGNHVELESSSRNPKVAKASPSENASTSIKLSTPVHSKMPAITMNWKKPSSPHQIIISKTFVKSPKSKKLFLDLDCRARLHPKRFESMWDDYAERYQDELSDVKQPHSDILKTLETIGISCMASGNVNGLEKFVFYAKQRNCSWFFLLTLDITAATRTAKLSLRATSDATEELVTQLIYIVKDTVSESAVS
ncbi:putative TBP domain superfamily, beta-adaptin appendage subdomain-containing protein [Plasmopara halstedii]